MANTARNPARAHLVQVQLFDPLLRDLDRLADSMGISRQETIRHLILLATKEGVRRVGSDDNKA